MFPEAPDQTRRWHHSPRHEFPDQGAYMVTAATYLKSHHFRTPERLQALTEDLLRLAGRYGWELQAWAVFSNHYHFVALSPEDPGTLRRMVSHLHTQSAARINAEDEEHGRKVWFQFWDTHLTYQRSYLARLNYVHTNPVKHGLVEDANAYPWCSAAWFNEAAPDTFQRTVYAFKSDRTSVQDDFCPVVCSPARDS